jgi:tol-pal system protein YbgF
MTRMMRVAPVALLVATGCLATKGDIRLLQDELRATRAQVGIVDTSIARANQARERQISALASQVERLTLEWLRNADSLRSLSSRFASFQGRVNAELDVISREMVKTQELLGQTTRNLQATRAQLEQIRDAGTTVAPPASGGTPNQPNVPGPATLFQAGYDALKNNAWGTARSNFELLVSTYPNSDEAPRAQYYIAESFAGEGNKAAADSVYQIVADKYPKSDNAANSLYKHGKYLWETKKTSEARIVLNRVIREYQGTAAAGLATDFLRTNRP